MITISTEVAEHVNKSITNILCWFAGYHSLAVTKKDGLDDLLSPSIKLLHEFNNQIRMKLDENRR